MHAVLSNLNEFLVGLRVTLLLTVLSGCIALTGGVLLAAARVSPVPILRYAATAYVEVVRNMPLTIVFFFVAFVLPQLGVRFSYFTFAVIALSVYYIAFFCEAVRSGINSVGVGQAEAARSIGLPFLDSLREIVLPQALRTVIPPLINVFIALIKSTAVASAFGVAELLTTGEHLANAESNAVLWILAATACFYLILTIPAGLFSAYLERKVAFNK
jgi:glutamate transport system permease protein